MNPNLFLETLPSVDPKVSRNTLRETETSDEIPQRAINFRRALRPSKDTLQTFNRLILKNTAQLKSFKSFKKILRVRTLIKRFARMNHDAWLAGLVNTLLNGKSLDTTTWKHLPSIEYLQHGSTISLQTTKLIAAIQFALMDAVRYCREEIERQLFMTVFLSFIANMSEQYCALKCQTVYSSLLSFQRELLAMNDHTTLDLNDSLKNDTDDKEAIAVELIEVNSIQSMFWSDKKAESKKRFSSDDEITDFVGIADVAVVKKAVAVAKEVVDKKKKKKRKQSKNEIDSIFNDMF